MVESGACLNDSLLRNAFRNGSMRSERSGPEPSTRRDILQPAPIKRRCGCLPCLLQRVNSRCFRERRKKFLSSIRSSYFPKGVQKIGGDRVKIPQGQRRIRLSFAAQKPLDISAVLLQERAGFILRMALKMNHQALLPLLHKQINSGIGRLGKHLITTGKQIILADFVPPGMRSVDGIWN